MVDETALRYTMQLLNFVAYGKSLGTKTAYGVY